MTADILSKEKVNKWQQLPTTDFKVIGTRPIRHDGVDKVTGRAKYGADYSFPGMLLRQGSAQPARPRA